jgi:hypothetical protein
MGKRQEWVAWQWFTLKITDYKMAPKGAPVNGANLGSMGFKLSTKLIIIR